MYFIFKLNKGNDLDYLSCLYEKKIVWNSDLDKLFIKIFKISYFFFKLKIYFIFENKITLKPTKLLDADKCGKRGQWQEHIKEHKVAKVSLGGNWEARERERERRGQTGSSPSEISKAYFSSTSLIPMFFK